MSDKVKTVYIAGPITGDPDYKNKFTFASEVLRGQGFIVCNPVVMLKSLVKQDASHRDLVTIGRGIAAAADVLALLPGWDCSEGAVLEFSDFIDAHHLDDAVYEFTIENARDLEGNLIPDVYSGEYREKQVKNYYQMLKKIGCIEGLDDEDDTEEAETEGCPF